jgi:4-hydroxy-tetrahydrodipicolinate reductase
MINIMLSGANGKMGKVITRLAEDMADVNICAGVDINTESGSFPVFASPYEYEA